MRNKYLLISLLLAFTLTSCGKDEQAKPVTISSEQPYIHGAYILCEGNFGWGEGSIYYFDTSSAAHDVADAYRVVNGFGAGNVVQNLTFSGNQAFLVVNNSNKIEALNRFTLKRKTLNTTLTSPRYAALLPNGNLAVTDLYAGYISILDTASLVTLKQIPAPGWTEQLLVHNNDVYVANRRQTAQASGSLNEQILTIDPSTLSILDSIKLEGQGAQELVYVAGDIVCSSLEKDFTLNQAPSIVLIDVDTKHIQHFAALPGKSQQPARLQIANGWILWLQGDKLGAMKTDGTDLQAYTIFDQGSNLTSLHILSYKDNWVRMLIGDSKNYISNGSIKDITLDLTIKTIKENRNQAVGIIPGEIYTF